MNSKALVIGTGLVRKSTGPQCADVHREPTRLAGPPNLQRKSTPPKLQRNSARSPNQRAGIAHFANNSAQLTSEANGYATVGDVMTTKVISVSPKTKVLEALDLIVKHRITGLPVVDEEGKVVGVVSDYDLLAMDMSELYSQGMFPSLDQSWQAFRQVKLLMAKIEGKTVQDVMTTDPVIVRPNTSLDMAARLLLESKIRRLPVLDKDGKLVGVISRRNVLVSALAERSMHNGNFDVVGQLA